MEHRRFPKHRDSAAGTIIKMRKKNENSLPETEAAFGFAVLLLNFLILAALSGIVRLMPLLISQGSPLHAALSETIGR